MVKQVKDVISQRHDRHRLRRAFNALFALFEARCRKRQILRAWLHQFWVLSLRSAFTWWQAVVSISRLEARAEARHQMVGVPFKIISSIAPSTVFKSCLCRCLYSVH